MTEAMSFLTGWTTTNRANPQTIIVSPDGSVVYTFTAGALSGVWNSSANFSTSEGSMITCSCGVMGLGRTEGAGTGYIGNSSGLGLYPDYHPYPYWKSTATITSNGGQVGGVGAVAVDWSIDVNNNPVVVYGCTGVMGPIAVLMGEIDATANVVLFNVSGVSGIPSGATAANTSVSIAFDGHTLSLPAAVFESDGNDMSGADSVISRSFGFKGLSSKTGGSGVGPFKMS